MEWFYFKGGLVDRSKASLQIGNNVINMLCTDGQANGSRCNALICQFTQGAFDNSQELTLLFFIGILGILNIINTVYSNIHTRVNEIGMQRAIGMSAASLYKTFLWEGAYYAIFASVIGAVLGYVCCIFVGAAKTDALQLVAVPVIAIIEAAVVSVAACLLATAIPLHSIAKMNIVETIENIE